MTEKLCRKCGQTKPADQMKRDPRYSDGLGSYCRACHSAISRAWQLANPVRVKEIQRKSRAKRPQPRRKASPNDRWARLRKLYRVEREWYETTLAAQAGRCAICARSPGKRPLAVDHDHQCCPVTPTCGKCNRGLLCSVCNLALNRLEREIDWADHALAYLAQHEGKSNGLRAV